MKRILGFLMVLMMVFTLSACGEEQEVQNKEPSVWDGTVAASFEQGDGSPEHPFEIATASQLAYLAQETNAGRIYYGQHFYISNNIILNDSTKVSEHLYMLNEYVGSVLASDDMYLWIPIGTEEHPFRGTVDGRGYTVTGMVIDDQEINHLGLFGYVENANISNLDMEDAYTLGGSASYAGGLVGLIEASDGNSASIDNCCVEAYVFVRGYARTVEDVYGCEDGIYFSRKGFSAGVIAGRAYNENNDNVNSEILISNCISDGAVLDRIDNGFADFLKTNYNMELTVFAHLVLSTEMGGVVGYADDNTNISGCVNYAMVESSAYIEDLAASDVAGIAGFANDVNINNCFNLGEIKSLDDTRSYGSIVGWYQADRGGGAGISGCYFLPEACSREYGINNNDSRISIMAATEENLHDNEWLYEHGVSDIWEHSNGKLARKSE